MLHIMKKEPVQAKATEGTTLIAPQFLGGNDMRLPAIALVKGEIQSPTLNNVNENIQNRRFLYCDKGNALLFQGDHTKHFLAPGTATFIQPGESWSLLLSRGNQSWIMCNWAAGNEAIPDEEITQTSSFLINNCSMVVRLLTERVVGRSDELGEWPNFALSWFNMLIHERHFTERTFALTPIFKNGADPIEDLITAIKTKPQQNWNLTDAAKLAGYSPFHLSRVFRAVANMGFPEFVDRCRTELAIDKLLTSNDQLNLISEQCGFGTPQAMRNACREYTGFLPSEFRVSSDQ